VSARLAQSRRAPKGKGDLGNLIHGVSHGLPPSWLELVNRSKARLRNIRATCGCGGLRLAESAGPRSPTQGIFRSNSSRAGIERGQRLVVGATGAAGGPLGVPK